MPRQVSATLVGRSAQWSRLVDAAAQAQNGLPTVALVRGEAGIGKTRLVGEWAEAARAQGAVVVLGRCIEVEGAALPLAPVAGVLRDLAGQLGRRSIQAAAGLQWPVITSMLPELADGNGLPGPVTHGQTFDAVAGLVRELSADDLLAVVLEDMHWSDTLTRDLVAYLARAMTGQRLLLVLTARPEATEPVDGFLAELVRLPTVDQIDVARLDPPQITELAAQLSDTPLRAAPLNTLIRLSDGVPFLVEELVAAGLDPTGSAPDTAGQLLLRRWSRLGPAARQVVVAASLADLELTDRLLRAALADEIHRPDPALREAVEAGVLTPAPDRDGYRFRHALLRAAVARTLLPGEARIWHQRWARALEATPRELDPLTQAVALAHHWDGAGDAPGALTACLAAAEQCRLHSAFVEQSQLLLRAVAWWDEVPQAAQVTGLDRALLAEDVVDALVAADAVQDLIEFAEAELRRTPEADQLHHARWRTLIADERADVERRSDHPDVPDLDDLIELVRTSPPGRDQVWSAHNLSWVLGSCNPERALEMIELAAASADVLDDADLSLRMTATRAYELDWLGRSDEALAEHLALLPHAHRLDAAGYSFFLVCMVSLNCELGWLEPALAAVADARHRLGDEQQAPLAWVQLTASHAMALSDLGRWDEAQQVYDAARMRYDDEDWPWFPALRTLLAAWRGDLAQAQQTAVSIRFNPDGPAGIWDFDGWVRVTIAAAHRDIEEIRQVVAGMLARRDIRASTVALRILLVAATAEANEAARARDLGDKAALEATETAVATLRQVLEQVRRPGPAAFAGRLHIAAELDRRAGSTDSEPWQATVDAWTPIGYPHERGWALLHLAEALVDSGRRDEAARALYEATAIADQLGARPLTDEAAAFARRARLRSMEVSTPIADEEAAGDTVAHKLGLTSREREVLALLCEGLNNPAIAKQLFMSPKTASVHVSRILAKLGATNRTQAATTAHRLGLGRPPS